MRWTTRGQEAVQVETDHVCRWVFLLSKVDCASDFAVWDEAWSHSSRRRRAHTMMPSSGWAHD